MPQRVETSRIGYFPQERRYTRLEPVGRGISRCALVTPTTIVQISAAQPNAGAGVPTMKHRSNARTDWPVKRPQPDPAEVSATPQRPRRNLGIVLRFGWLVCTTNSPKAVDTCPAPKDYFRSVRRSGPPLLPLAN